MKQINKLYGVLTNGGGTTRRSTVNRTTYDADVQKIAEALIPSGWPVETKTAVAEMWIRVCHTAPDIIETIAKTDPLNTYRIFTVTDLPHNHAVDINAVVENIKSLGLPGENTTFMPCDYIVNALRNLVQKL